MPANGLHSAGQRLHPFDLPRRAFRSPMTSPVFSPAPPPRPASPAPAARGCACLSALLKGHRRRAVKRPFGGLVFDRRSHPPASAPISTSGYPASTPPESDSRTAASIAGSSTAGSTSGPHLGCQRQIPAPWSSGLSSSTTRAYCVLPPRCAVNSPAARARRGDRLAIGHLGPPHLGLTLNSRTRRSTRISRCSSPMPEMIVWPVFSSLRHRKVGSSSASDLQRAQQLLLVGRGARLDRHIDHRLREADRFQHHRVVRVTQRVAGEGEL